MTIGVRRRVSLLAGLWLLLVTAGVLAAPVAPSQLTSALHWRDVGPYIGGRVTSVAGIASEPNTFYAAYAGSGVWKTDNYGKTWKMAWGKHLPTSNIGAIAIDPSNPKIIYAGAGDSAPRNTVLTSGGGTGGIYKSTDGGKTWKHLGLRKTNVISWIIVDPDNPDVVYVAALGHLFAPNPERGVYKSSNGGKTWNKVLFVNDQTGAITLAMDPSNPQVLYASMWQVYRRPWTFSSGGPGSGIYKTTDGGAHWTNITHNQGLPKGIFGKVGVAVAPSDPNVVYALIQAKYKPGHPGGLFRSDDGGQTWKLMNDSSDITQRAFYYMRVYVDPKDADTIYLPNVDLFVSHDGGKKLTKLHPPHGDNHAFWINPNNPKTLIEGNDGGATVSQNGGKNWSTEHNQPTAQYYHANLDNQFPFHIYGAQQDEGAFESPSAVRRGGIPGVWQRLAGGEETWVASQPSRPWVTYGFRYYSRMVKENRRSNVFTNISPLPAFKYGLKMAKVKYRYGWIHHPIVTVPGQPEEILVGAQAVLKSMDAGIHWKPISPDLTRNDKSKQQRSGGPISADMTGEENFDTISVIGVSPLDHDIIWTGSDDGLVYVTTDGGGHWQQVRPPRLPKWSTISGIDPSPTTRGTAYVAASRYMWDDFHPYLYKTTDYGKHWTRITNGLPSNQYVTNVRQDPNQANLVFAATSSTVYMSLDGGSHWMPLTLNLPTVRVTDIAIQPKQHAVVLSTFGYGFWVLDDLQFLEQLNTAKVASDAPYLFKPQQTWLVKRQAGGHGHSRTDNTGKNLRPGLTVFFHLPANYDGKTPVKLSFTTADGKLIRSFTLPVKEKKVRGFGTNWKNPKKLHPGMNRFQWNLHYPNATDVTGIFHTSDVAHVPVGPAVLPGTYDAVLSFGNARQRQAFTVELDPRLDTTPAELQARFNLLMQLHQSVNRLDVALNHAIAARSAIKKKLSGNNSGRGAAARQALTRLNQDIVSLVDLQIQSNEGGVVYPSRLHAWLTEIASRIRKAFVPPTPAMRQVAETYMSQSRKAVTRLKSDTAHATAATGTDP